MAHRLAQRLGNADIGADLILHAFRDAIGSEPGIGDAARADIVATFDRDPACDRYIDPLLYFKGYQAIQTHRMAHALWGLGRNDFAYYLQSRLSVLTSIDIHPAARIGKGIMVDHGHDIVIGETCVIEDNVSIMQGVTLGGTSTRREKRHPTLEDEVTVGAGAQIIGAVTIGTGAKIGAGSVVVSSVPPGATVVGVPGHIVAFTNATNDTVERLPDPEWDRLQDLERRIADLERQAGLPSDPLDQRPRGGLDLCPDGADAAGELCEVDQHEWL